MFGGGEIREKRTGNDVSVFLSLLMITVGMPGWITAAYLVGWVGLGELLSVFSLRLTIYTGIYICLSLSLCLHDGLFSILNMILFKYCHINTGEICSCNFFVYSSFSFSTSSVYGNFNKQ